MRVHKSRRSGRVSRLYQRSFTLTVSEGEWNDWWMGVEATDESGRRICALSEERGASLESITHTLMLQAVDAVEWDFLTKRPKPLWPEAVRRWLWCRLAPLRNRWRQRRLARSHA